MFMKWIMAVLVGLAAALAIYLMLYQYPSKEKTEDNSVSIEIPDTPADPAQAESVYRSNCMGCHGDQYQGKSGPALTTVGATMTRENIYKKILKGGGGMVPFENKLDDAEIVNLTNWLATFK